MTVVCTNCGVGRRLCTFSVVGNSDEARTAATVLFCLMAIMLVVAIAAAVIAGVLFWKWRNEQKKAGFEPSE